MKTHYEHIHFTKMADKPKTTVWACKNNKTGDVLGAVKWYGPWRQYCYFPSIQAVYNTACLHIIENFLAELNLNQMDKEHATTG